MERVLFEVQFSILNRSSRLFMVFAVRGQIHGASRSFGKADKVLVDKQDLYGFSKAFLENKMMFPKGIRDVYEATRPSDKSNKHS